MKLVLPTNKGVPPVGVAYHSTVCPSETFTISAGVVVPSQITGKFGLLGAGTVGQVQLGAATACCCEQVVAVLVAVRTTFVPLGILEMVKLGVLPVTVPAEVNKVVALDVTLME